MLELKQVNKKYGKTRALSGISLSFGPGELIGIFGENGAGKTTLMKAILGYIRFDGEITLDGEPVSRKNIARLSFATCEHSFFPELTAKEHAEFYEGHFPGFDRKRFEALMEFFELPSDRKTGRMSAGQQNQMEVILALCQGADYILMDEPFAGNDIFNREDFYKVLIGLLRENETVILSTHLIEEVSGFVGRAVFMHKGKVIGDEDVLELNDRGITLIDRIKELYHYRENRVTEILDKIDQE